MYTVRRLTILINPSSPLNDKGGRVAALRGILIEIEMSAYFISSRNICTSTIFMIMLSG